MNFVVVLLQEYFPRPTTPFYHPTSATNGVKTPNAGLDLQLPMIVQKAFKKAFLVFRCASNDIQTSSSFELLEFLLDEIFL